jgi:Pvc16 N-terminal domain
MPSTSQPAESQAGQDRREHSALTLAAVTAVMKDLLSNGLVEHGIPAALGDVPVTALPPDRIPIGEEERSQLNIYLYRLTPNSSWRLPERVNGNQPRSAPTMDLHYLLIAYGAQDLQSEILLGAAVELMHDHPVVGRETLHATMAAGSSAALSSPTRAALAAAAPEFAAIERLEITPEYLSSEETTKLWSALQAHFRTSVAYKVSVVPTGRRAASGA